MVYLHNYINSLDGADGSESSSAWVKICVNSDFTWRALGRFSFPEDQRLLHAVTLMRPEWIDG